MTQMCKQLGVEFLTMRVWASVWLLLAALVTTAFEGASLLKYITRFTEDVFSTLISAIFISESVKFLMNTLENNPIGDIDYYTRQHALCVQQFAQNNTNNTGVVFNSEALYSFYSADTWFVENVDHSDGIYGNNDTTTDYTQVVSSRYPAQSALSLNIIECQHRWHQPDTSVVTIGYVVATFVLAYAFKILRKKMYLGRKLRQAICDFGVLIAIAIVSTVGYLITGNVYIQHVDMPHGIGHTSGSYDIFVNIWFKSDQLWAYGFAIVPALLLYFLVFVETQITELLLLRTERGLAKGNGGHHWDIPLSGALAVVCAVFGLPWMCVAAVQSLAHCASLTVMTKPPPGVRATVDYVLEQRVTTIVVSLLVGSCAFMGSYISHLPLAVLFGVFLYLATMNLSGVEFITRLMLVFIPQKYYPDHPYCQQVKRRRMFLYTMIQLLGLIGVYLVKHFKHTRLGFPFALLVLAVVRSGVLTKIFSKCELNALDASDDDEMNEPSEIREFLTAFSTGGSSKLHSSKASFY